MRSVRDGGRAAALAVWLAMLPGAAARADEVVLNTGGAFSGIVMDDSPERVVIQGDGAFWTLRRGKIRSVVLEPEGRAAEERKAKEYADRLLAAIHANDVLAGAPKPRAADRKAAASPGPSGPTVVVYGAEWCTYCRATRDFLVRNRVPFELRDVDDPVVYRERLVVSAELGVRPTGIPLIRIGQRATVGFNASFIRDALKLPQAR